MWTTSSSDKVFFSPWTVNTSRPTPFRLTSTSRGFKTMRLTILPPRENTRMKQFPSMSIETMA